MDWSKLTPAPLTSREASSIDDTASQRPVEVPPHVVHLYRDDQGREVTVHVADFQLQTDADFYALARNAFDVMMRRQWCPVWVTIAAKWAVGRWHGSHGQPVLVEDQNGDWIAASDPFTALVEANRCYAEHVEKEAP